MLSKQNILEIKEFKCTWLNLLNGCKICYSNTCLKRGLISKKGRSKQCIYCENEVRIPFPIG